MFQCECIAILTRIFCALLHKSFFRSNAIQMILTRLEVSLQRLFTIYEAFILRSRMFRRMSIMKGWKWLKPKKKTAPAKR